MTHLRRFASALTRTPLVALLLALGLLAAAPGHARALSAPPRLAVSTTTAPVPPPTTGERPAPSANPHPGAGGHVYYLDAQNGSDTAAGTSPATAWRTLARITAAHFAPGDVIALHRGQTFTGTATVNDSGTAAARLTITAYGAGTPPTLSNPTGWNMLQLGGSYIDVSYLRFSDGVVFQDTDGTGIRGPKYQLSGAIAVTDDANAVHVHDNEFTQVGVGVKTYGTNTVIDHNTIHDLKIAFRGVDSGSETSYGAIGVSINNSGAKVSDNQFVNCRSTDSPYGADGGAVEIEGLDHPKDNITIDHNYSSGSQGFLEVTETTTAHVNVSYNLSDDYQQFLAFDTTTSPDDYTVDHNTIIRTRNDNSELFAIYYYRQAGPTPQDSWLTISSNIIDLTSGVVLSDYLWPHNHNLINGNLGTALGAGDLQADPQFNNAAGGDYTLTATSPAIDNAGPATQPTDLYGNPSSIGQAPDMGAVEYQHPAKSTPSVLSDGGFEQQTTLSATTTPWYSSGPLATGIDIAAGKSHGGQSNAWISSASSATWGAIQQDVAVQPNTTYRLTAWISNANTIQNGWIGARTTAGTVLGEVEHGYAAGYTRVTLAFNTGTATHLTVYSGIYGATSGVTWQQLDDVTLQPQ